jgi:hypothetical protein
MTPRGSNASWPPRQRPSRNESLGNLDGRHFWAASVRADFLPGKDRRQAAGGRLKMHDPDWEHWLAKGCVSATFGRCMLGLRRWAMGLDCGCPSGSAGDLWSGRGSQRNGARQDTGDRPGADGGADRLGGSHSEHPAGGIGPGLRNIASLPRQPSARCRKSGTHTAGSGPRDRPVGEMSTE